MTTDARARRYLLGTASEEERAAIEEEYFAHEERLDRIAEAEDDLIEDYLDDRLHSDERVQFEREYLASPVHRTRVETIRRLRRRAASSSAPAPASSRAGRRWLAAAAALVLTAGAVGAGVWMAGRRDAPTREAARSTPAPTPSAPSRPSSRTDDEQPPRAAPPRIYAVVLSPLAVRSAGESPRVVIPPATDVVELRFETDTGPATSGDLPVAIATVSGIHVWRGAALRDGSTPRVHVPASLLAPDDYIVTWHSGTGEEARYFLRVRHR